jgi:hypothetical protein
VTEEAKAKMAVAMAGVKCIFEYLGILCFLRNDEALFDDRDPRKIRKTDKRKRRKKKEIRKFLKIGFYCFSDDDKRKGMS